MGTLFNFIIITLVATVIINDASSKSCPLWMNLNKSPVCFGALDNQYGKFTYSRNIFVSSFMVVHRTGSVTCNKKGYSCWGCVANASGLGVVITDHAKKLLAPISTDSGGWYSLVSYTTSSSVLVFCASKKPHCIFANTELRLWYGEDLRGFTEGDNGGKTCADVYGY